MRKLIDRYYGRLRRLKVNYILFNLVSGRRLRHARAMYRKYGIRRSALLPISSEELPPAPQDMPWLDTPEGAAALANDPGLQRFSAATREQIMHWPEKGYLILKSLFRPEEVDAINAEVDRLVRDKVVDFNFTGRKIMFAFRHSSILRQYTHDRRILDVMDFLLRKRMRVFQSINFLTGSEQAAHSDSIHMTTYPLGYMAAAWVALEKMTPANGPLIYYPGSHKLPYLLNGRYNHGGSRLTIGEEAYARYEKEVQRAVEAGRFEAVELLVEPGDVLIWHANLVHGGKKMTRPNASRKSMVVHCFADDVLCYHELTQRAALMDEA